LDFRNFELSGKELLTKFVEQANVLPSEGSIFGREGEGFIRLNIACPRSVLIDALERIKKAFM
jgi:cysteine-S-conjugate beta-lyase